MIDTTEVQVVSVDSSPTTVWLISLSLLLGSCYFLDPLLLMDYEHSSKFIVQFTPQKKS